MKGFLHRTVGQRRRHRSTRPSASTAACDPVSWRSIAQRRARDDRPPRAMRLAAARKRLAQQGRVVATRGAAARRPADEAMLPPWRWSARELRARYHTRRRLEIRSPTEPPRSSPSARSRPAASFGQRHSQALTSRKVPTPAGGQGVEPRPGAAPPARCCCVIIRAVTSGSTSATAGAGPKTGPKPTAPGSLRTP